MVRRGCYRKLHVELVLDDQNIEELRCSSKYFGALKQTNNVIVTFYVFA